MRAGHGAQEPLRVLRLRRAYEQGGTSARGVVGEVTRRIAAAGPAHAWITRVPDRDLADRAGALDRLPAAQRGALHGIPFAVKDNIDVAGLPTTAGCPDFGYAAQRTAPAVQRLLDAGALLVGKTNLDQFATGLTGTRSPYGACESVFGGGLISGGSSSGSAVAVAAGVVAFALGTDTAGSGRVPAALNGIVGLKPTRGLVSTAGVVPACRSLDCVSIFAHDTADAAAVLGVVAGPDPADPWSRRPPEPAPERPDAAVVGRPLRVGVAAPGDADAFGDSALLRRYEAGCARVLGATGAAVTVDLAPFLEAGDLLYEGPWVAERLAGLAEFLHAHPRSVLPVTRRVLERGRGIDAVEVFRAQHRLQALRARVDRVWDDVDVLVLPTIATTFTIAQVEAEPYASNAALGRFTHFANLLDLAAVAVPNGLTADGRPAGLSFIGPAWSEATLLGVAGEFDGGWRPHRAAAPRPPASLTRRGAAMPPSRPATPSGAARVVEARVVEARVVEARVVEARAVEARVVEARAVEAQPYAFEFAVQSTALLVIDMQRDFVEPGGFGQLLGNDVSPLRSIVAPLRRVLDTARATGMTVIHTREGHRPDLSDCPPAKRRRGRLAVGIGDRGPNGRILVRGERGHDIIDELAPQPGEPVVDKPGKGSFYATDLDAILTARGITHLVVTGVTTEVCVHTTVREANDRGYEVLVLSDCVQSYFPEFQRVALQMISAQGGIFGWVAPSSHLLHALPTPATIPALT